MPQKKTTKPRVTVLLAHETKDADTFNAADQIHRSNAIRAAAAPVTPELLEGRSLMSASTADAFNSDGSVVDHGSVAVNLQHAPHGILAESAEGTTQQTKAERKAARQQARADGKAEKDAAKEEKVAAREAKKAARAARKAERRSPQAEAPASITSLTVVNAHTDSDFTTLSNGMTVDLAEVGSRYVSVRAATGGETSSVVFTLDGKTMKTDDNATYALRGGHGHNYRGWKATEGVHTLTVTPFARNGGKGDAGEGVSVSFTVVDTNSSSSQDDQQETPTPPQSSNPTPAPTPVQDWNADVTPPAVQAPAPAPVPVPVPTPPPSNPTMPGNNTNGPAAAPIPSGDTSNQAPTVSILSTGVTTFAGPVTTVLRATVGDTDGKVTRVDFFANGVFVGTSNGAPHMVAWTDVQPGSYNVTATAYDDDGAATTSAATTYTIVNNTGGKVINVNPGDNLAKAVRSAQAGDTVLIQPGTYTDQIRLYNNGTAEKPITIKAAQGPGTVIIDGQGTADRLLCPDWEGTGHWTTVDGLTFENVANKPGQDNAAIKTTDGDRFIDVTVHDTAGAGVAAFGDNVVLQRVTAYNNGCTGIGGSRVSNALVIDCVSHGNNTGHFSGSFEGGGGKFTKADGLLVQNHLSYDNFGPGIWFDIDNVNVVVRDGVFHDNHDLFNSNGSERIGGRGIMLEISGIDAASDGSGKIDDQGPILIDGNLTYDNDNAGLQVYATAHVTAINNEFINDYVDLKDKRPAPWVLNDLTFKDNELKDTYLQADGTVNKDYASKGLDIDDNVYDSTGKPWKWNGHSYSLDDVAGKLGFEKNGSLGSILFSKAA